MKDSLARLCLGEAGLTFCSCKSILLSSGKIISTKGLKNTNRLLSQCRYLVQFRTRIQKTEHSDLQK